MSEGNVRPAGEGLSDQEMVEEVAGQTDSAMDAQDMDEDVRGGGGDDAGAADDYDPARRRTPRPPSPTTTRRSPRRP